MKYLEKYQDSSSYYYKISSSEFGRDINQALELNYDNPFEGFDDREIELLSNMGFEILINRRVSAVRYKKNDFPPFIINTSIFKMKDEWYLVTYDSSTEKLIEYYKCDQLPGLKMLLKQLLKFPN